MDKDFREVFKPATDVLNKYKNDNNILLKFIVMYIFCEIVAKSIVLVAIGKKINKTNLKNVFFDKYNDGNNYKKIDLIQIVESILNKYSIKKDLIHRIFNSKESGKVISCRNIRNSVFHSLDKECIKSISKEEHIKYLKDFIDKIFLITNYN